MASQSSPAAGSKGTIDLAQEEDAKMISSDEGGEGEKGLEEEGGFSTPKARGQGSWDREARTPTGWTPDSKRSRKENEREQETEGEGAAEPPPAQPMPSSQVTYQGVQVAPPPGFEHTMGQGSASQGSDRPVSPPNAPLTLSDLLSQLQQGFQRVETRIDGMRENIDRDVGKLRAEQRETKEIATKALTVADTTNKEVKTLSQRVEALERGDVRRGGSAAARSSSKARGGTEELGYNSLGGEEGNEMVVGAFDQYASREERKENWELMKQALPESILSQIDKAEAPGLRNRVMIVSIRPSPDAPTKTRESLLNICRDIRQAKVHYKDTEGTLREIFANPTKPLAMRQQQAQVTLKADALRKALGEERAQKIELELGKSRVFFGKDILAQRQTQGGEMMYQWPSIHKHLPDCTPELLGKYEEEVAAARAAQRA